MKENPKRILVTNALPYANGSLHLGHMLEYVQTDIWVRFQRLSGKVCYYVCADDAHGTPIMLKAREEKVAPETLIAKYHKEHLRDFANFQISFDYYHSTHSKENRKFSTEIYEKLLRAGHISSQEIVQAFDEKEQIFLPDRYVRGNCPRCDSPDQYGDCCEVCGATYEASELKSSYSVLSGQPPIYKKSNHLFFRLSDFTEQLRDWLAKAETQSAIRNKLEEWFASGLKNWNISRDAPYFGFPIPGQTGKYFYVWLDAPIGYMAAFKALCDADKDGPKFADYWEPAAEKNTQLRHFIGKDIAYFHTLFWPAMLMGAGYRVPTAVHCHGFLTVNGQKMSKSRGTFITAARYIEVVRDPEYLRYYFACKSNDGVDDIDLNLDDFVKRVNSDLVGKLVNIASRCARYISANCDDEIVFNDDPSVHARIHDRYFAALTNNKESSPEISAGKHGFIAELEALFVAVAKDYESLNYSRAMREIMLFADRVNRWLNLWRPWSWEIRNNQLTANIEAEGLRPYKNIWQYVCGHAAALFASLASLLKPVLPEFCGRVENYLQIRFDGIGKQVFANGSHRIGKFAPLIKRLERKKVAALVDEPTTAEKTNLALAKETMISINDFSKLDLRVARVVRAEEISQSDKLLKITLDSGDGETKTVFSGIKKSYRASDLEGRLVVYLANLKVRKMSFGVSSGMVLAAGKDEVFLLGVDSGAQPGMKIT